MKNQEREILRDNIRDAEKAIDKSYSKAEVLAIMEKVRDECAEKADNVEMLCGEAIRKRLVDKTSCGTFCGGCDSSIIGPHDILQIDLNKYLTK